jgi:uroporphyrinogen decarboxylase
MPAATMNHWERVTAAIAGQPVDRVPVSLWRHFPEIDLDPAQLAEASVRWQRTYDFDLVKFMPSGTYGVEDWGAKTAYLSSPIGTRTVIQHGLTSAEEWPRLAGLSPAEGRLGQEVKAIALAAEALKGEVPILQTLFGPLTTAYKLAGDRVFADLRRHPDLFEAGLAIIAETTLAFARACLRAGAHGVFFSTQCASYRMLSEAEHLRFGVAYDRRVLDGLGDESRFTMLHLHGNDVMFDQMLAYPANMANWHDRKGELTLAGATSRFGGLLVGGLNEDVTLPQGPIEAIKAEVRDAIAQTGGRRLMIAPGCVIPIATPESHYRAVIEAVSEMAR